MRQRTTFADACRSAAVGIVVAVGLIAGIVVVAVPSGAVSGWSITPSPSPPGPPSGDLSAVSCASTTSCFAVGSSQSGPLVETWNGTAWSIAVVPSPSGQTSAALDGVSCPSATSCFAVGSTDTATLVEHWNGTSWTVVASPNPPRPFAGALSAVSCVSAADCFAVGNASSEGANLVFKLLVEHWDGKVWSIVAAPNPTGTQEAALSGVSCATTTSCFAVGASDAGLLVERWNGKHWAIVPSPSLPGQFARPSAASISFSPGLDGVSCLTATDCTAVGDSFTGALIEHWNGTRWSIVATPTPSGVFSPGLSGVSCWTSKGCVAVGSYSTTPNGETSKELVEQWNGKRWSIVASPDLPGSFLGVSVGGFEGLIGVSCPSATSCAAVGNSALVDRWNGSVWSVAALHATTSQSELGDVSCPTVTNCFAVGTSNSKPFIEHWNGTRWSVATSPNPSGSVDASLQSVSCPTITACTAVGTFAPTPFASQTLVERWNGQVWSIVTSPNPNKTNARLSAVSCPTATDCTAVGASSGKFAGNTLIEHWNGIAWSIVTSPSPSKIQASLYGVSCAAVTDCTAVGDYLTNSTRTGAIKTLVEHWNGTVWSIVTNPSPAAGFLASLTSVACASPVDCSAIGYDIPKLTITHLAVKPFGEHWNGTTWSAVTLPNPTGSTGTFFGDIACPAVNDCNAVGVASFTVSSGQTLAEHWNGTAWSLVPTPNPPGTALAALDGVSCPTPTTCIAVGYTSANASINTLTERNS